MSNLKKFKNEAEERVFWDKTSPLDFADNFKEIQIEFPNLKPTTQPITMRIPKSLLTEIKVIANKKDVPYQSLIKMWLSEKVEETVTFKR